MVLNLFRVAGMDIWTGWGIGSLDGREGLTRSIAIRGPVPSGVNLYFAAQDCPAQGALPFWFLAKAASRTNTPQSCAGISFKSQVLYLIVYIMRYLGAPSPCSRAPSPNLGS